MQYRIASPKGQHSPWWVDGHHTGLCPLAGSTGNGVGIHPFGMCPPASTTALAERGQYWTVSTRGQHSPGGCVAALSGCVHQKAALPRGECAHTTGWCPPGGSTDCDRWMGAVPGFVHQRTALPRGMHYQVLSTWTQHCPEHDLMAYQVVPTREQHLPWWWRAVLGCNHLKAALHW